MLLKLTMDFQNKKFQSQLPLFEGYPTYSWKKILGSNRRRPGDISNLLKQNKFDIRWTKENQNFVNKDSNFADAFVLALTLSKLKNMAFKQNKNIEGSILGFIPSDCF